MGSRILKLALAALAAAPMAASALGLGDIRLNSSLNAPLDAEIELIGAAPDELASLRAQVASRDTFARYGLDYPAFLANLRLEQVRGADGRQLIRVRSAETITEPFLTFLVEVNWSRGRLVREYTMLLDPPVYTPGTRAADSAPVAAPTAGASARQGTIERESAPPPAASQPENAAPVAQPALASGDYRVTRGDTLSAVARRYGAGSGAAARQWMLAVYQANPQAFDGNMNLLRSGAVLRVPDASAIAAISPGEATAEVRRQYAAWRGSAAPSAAAEPGRLRLVTPSDPSTSPGAGGDGQSRAEVASLQDRVRELETQLNESRRLLEVRNAELAALQARAAGTQPGTATEPAPVAEQPAPAVAESPTAEEPALAATEVPADTAQPDAAATSEAVADTGAPEATAGADGSEAGAAEPPAAAARPAATTPRGASSSSSESSLLDTLLGFWWVLALALVALLALFGVRAWRSRKQAEFDDSLGRLASAGADALYREPTLGPTPGMRQAALAGGPREQAAFVVEETGAHERRRAEEEPRGAPAPSRTVSADETMSSETAINLDQGDALAEADFHMAYGLYDQAADLVRIAIEREPERRDLRLKLLEVFFVWGNKDQFLQTARELAQSRSQAMPGEWEKIVIMGKQLAPEDSMFSSGAAVSGAAAGGVDLDLEGGQNRVDFDLLGDPPSTPASADGIDLDLGGALDRTGEAPSPMFDVGGSTAEMPGSATGTTREMTATLGADSDATLSDFAVDGGESPTIEQPGLYSQDKTVRQKLETALKHQGGGEQTAELNIDDLGLDLGSLDTMNNPALNATQETPTLVAGLDDRSRAIMEEAGVDDTQAATGSWQLDTEIGSSDATLPPSSVRALDGGYVSNDPSATMKMTAGEVDFDLTTPSASSSSAANGHGIDLDVGPPATPDTAFTATQKLPPEDLALPDLEPVTMSEVGTKLDLARAYMDMGDPEGARNILEEVLQEGSVAQKQEAQRLIESLPG